MKHFLFYCLFFSFCLPISANWQRSVTNYARHNYRSGNQNWMITQHGNGWMYFANNKGLLEFDGAEWNTYSINNAKTRSVKIGNDGRIYIGGMGQFGYFVPNKLGGLNYICLSDSIDKSVDIGIVWNIHIVDDRVYFQSEWAIFCLDHGKIKVVPSNSEIKYSAVINNKFYVVTRQGLEVLNGDEFSSMVNTEQLTPYKVVGLLPFEDKILIVTSRDGLFLYDGSSLVSFHSAADSFIHDNLLFCAGKSDSLLALGSVKDGILLLNLQTDQIEKISINNGLQNKTVLGLFFDRDNNLWLGLDNGIDCIHLGAPLFSLYGNRLMIGSGYASHCYNGSLYLATNQGLYQTDIPEKLNEDISMKFVSGIEGQIWSLEEHDNELFCGSDNGIFVLNGKDIYNIVGIKGVWRVISFTHRPDMLIAGTYNGFYVLHKVNGKWQLRNRVHGFTHSCKSMYAESPNVLWIANKGKGLYRLTLSSDLDSISKIKNYNSELLLPNNDVYVTRVNKEIVIVAREGLFHYNQIKDELERYNSLESLLDGKVRYTYINQDKYGNIWYVAGSMLKLLRFDPVKKSYYKNKNESYLRGALIDNFEHLYLCDDSQAIIGTEEGFSLLKFKNKYHESKLNLQIRKVYLTGGKDSLVYGRSYQYNDVPLVLSYNNNSLRIEFSVNNYDKTSSTFYSCYLSGSKDDSWGEYSESNTKEYTDLREGKYTFYVKLITDRDKDPIITSFSFEVLPPWYRSWWAYTIYAILICLFLYYVCYRIKEGRKQLIMQKEMELLRQKQAFKKESEIKDKKIDSLKEENLQSEVRHQSEELIRTTLNIVRKNEMLQEIKKEVVGITHAVDEENLVSIRRKTLRLMNRIDTNIQHDDDLQAFQSHFDSIHAGFFKVLDERFPDLNNKDKMLCAYIRMNLLSKEIAPLLNISLRGVEISRYRLRKKLELGEKDNLAEFLQHLTRE